MIGAALSATGAPRPREPRGAQMPALVALASLAVGAGLAVLELLRRR